MKAHLRSARIAPKKANIIAKMVRGMPVTDAIHALSRTNKKGARMVEDLLKSAVANAEHNDKQKKQDLMVKTIIVNQSMGYSRGVPKARGSIRPMMKFLSHITVTLGIGDGEKKTQTTQKTKRTQKTDSKKSSSKSAASSSKSSSQNAKTPVKKSSPTKTDAAPAAGSSVSDSKAQPASDDAPSSDSSSSAS